MHNLDDYNANKINIDDYNCYKQHPTMKHISNDFNELIKAKNSQVYATMLTVKTIDQLYLPTTRDSIASTIAVDDQVKKTCKKLVSFGKTVQVREYSVIQGDHPACKLPLSLDWEYTVSQRDINESRVRLSRYEVPRRWTLEDRRQRIYGSVQDNLLNFEQADHALEELLEGLNDLLTQAAIPDLPPTLPALDNNHNNNTRCLLSVPRLEDYAPSDCPSWDLTSLPSSLASYDEFLGGTDRLDSAPIVHWKRIPC
jgi:hypothetical protein